jgi:hypothetical protein
MNGIIFVTIAVSGLGHGGYWRGGIATLKNGDGDTLLDRSLCATVSGMNEFLILAGGQGGLVPVYSPGRSSRVDFFILCRWDNFFTSGPGRVARYVYCRCS